MHFHIWNLSTDQVYETGEIGSLGEEWLWHMDADENILVVFEFDWIAGEPPKVQQTKWTLTGQPLDKRHFHLSLSSVRGFDETRLPLRFRCCRTLAIRP